MEIDKEDFDRGMRLIGTSNEKIIDWLNSNNFELEDDAGQVFGIFEPHHFLDEELRDGQLPDVLLDKELIDELRYHQLLNGEEPNQQEINLCKVELVRSKRDDFPEGSTSPVGSFIPSLAWYSLLSIFLNSNGHSQ